MSAERYRVTLPIQLDGYRYGILFFRGVGETDSVELAERMRRRGFSVEGGSASLEEDLEGMTVQRLRRYAAEHGINLDGAAHKRDILEAIQGGGK